MSTIDQVIATLKNLPINNKTLLKNSRILPVVEKWSQKSQEGGASTEDSFVDVRSPDDPRSVALSKTLALLKEQGAVLAGTAAPQTSVALNPAETGDATTLTSGIELPQKKEGDPERNSSDEVKNSGVVEEEKLRKESTELEMEGDWNDDKVGLSSN